MYKKIAELTTKNHFFVNDNHVICWERPNKGQDAEGIVNYYEKESFKLINSITIDKGWAIIPKGKGHVWVITTNTYNRLFEIFIDDNEELKCEEKYYEDFTPKNYQFEKKLTIGVTLSPENKNISTGYKCIDERDKTYWEIKEANSGFYLQGDTFLVYHRQNLTELRDFQLLRVDILTGTVLWRKNMNEYYSQEGKEIKKAKLLGYLNGKFYLTLNVQSTLEIDFETGEMTRRWDWKQGYPKHSTGANSCLLVDEMKIAGISNRDYWEIDLNTSEIRTESLFEQFCEENILANRPRQLVFTDRHVIFLSERGKDRSDLSIEIFNQIVALNRETMEIDWKYRFKEDGYGAYLRTLKMDENHLYVLDNVHKLHIFKKQKNMKKANTQI